MLNHQKGPKQNLKKKLLFTISGTAVPQTNDQLGANAPTRLLGPPSNWPYDESFALAMHAAAAVRGMTWNDGDRSTQLICTFFLPRAFHSGGHQAAASSTAELQYRGGNFACTGPWTWGETCDVQLVALELTKVVRGTLGSEYAQLSSLSSWRSRRKECWVPWIYSYSTPQTSWDLVQTKTLKWIV